MTIIEEATKIDEKVTGYFIESGKVYVQVIGDVDVALSEITKKLKPYYGKVCLCI